MATKTYDFQRTTLPFISIPLIIVFSLMVAYFGLWAVIGLIALILAIIILRYPFLGLLFFIASIPLESAFLSFGGGVLSGTRLLGIYIFGVWALQILVQKRSLNFPHPIKIATLFIIWSTLSFFWAWHSERALAWMQTVVQLFALIVLVVNQINSRKRLEIMLFVLAFSCLLVALLGLLGVGAHTYHGLLTLEGQGAKEYSSYVGTAFLIGTILAAFSSGWMRVVSIIIVLIVAIPLIAGGERGIILALGLSWIALAIISRQKFKVFVFIIIVFLVFYFGPKVLEDMGLVSSLIVDRLSVESIIETRGSNRVQIWKVGINIVKDNLIIGTGLGNFPFAHGIYTNTEGFDAHNDWLRIAGELGIIGLFIFQFLLTYIGWHLINFVRTLTHHKKNLVALIVLALLIYSVSIGLTSTYVWRKIYWLVLSLAIITPRLLNDVSDVTESSNNLGNID